MEKFYPLAHVYLMNAVCDIAEMRKAKTTSISKYELLVETEMYKIKTRFMFRLKQSDHGTTLSIETEGDAEDSRNDISLMFTILDGMIAPIIENETAQT